MGGGGWYYVPKVSIIFDRQSKLKMSIAQNIIVCFFRRPISVLFFFQKKLNHRFLGLVASGWLVEQSCQLETQYRNCRDCYFRPCGSDIPGFCEQRKTSGASHASHPQSVLVQACCGGWPKPRSKNKRVMSGIIHENNLIRKYNLFLF